MTQKDKLKKIIEKAVECGFKTDWFRNNNFTRDEQYGEIWQMEGLFEIIFSPEFGRAYFGEKEGCSACHNNRKNKVTGIDSMHGCVDERKPAWIYHQHQLLTEIQEGRDPLLYLEKFI